MTGQSASDTETGAPLGDLGRRLAARRGQLGLTRGEAAARAGVAVAYLRYLEEHPGAAPGPGVLGSLAAALETSVAELTGGAVEQAPGSSAAARTAKLTELSLGECQALLGTHGVGRLAVTTSSGPVIVPVNYSVVDGAIVYRTAPGATPSLAAGSQVAFEVDRIDDTFSRGWSVLVRGPAHTVTDPQEKAKFTELAHTTPWTGGVRDVWVRIEPQIVTGRRITV
ncbi:pyridoxamine 5'-phosphate oxidase family protein [Streptomyces sp. NK08204]|uniref:pyridoxamine 5'-phosphate oxidase family protein n=1 Tax=Streptomyces sp. NK08204 TaxID=2873260 RepID=UPI001CEDBBB3|nr:pyridoxamine 5'-phosphate oxidase family protein [Streptomyces sp. NK08204]